jgi:hypothetical protein
MSPLPQHLESRLRMARQERRAKQVTSAMRWCFWLGVAIVAISRLFPK